MLGFVKGFVDAWGGPCSWDAPSSERWWKVVLHSDGFQKQQVRPRMLNVTRNLLVQ